MKADFLSHDAPAWRAALAGMQHDFFHLPAYLVLSARYEGGVPLAFLAERGDRRLLLPLLVRPIDPALSAAHGRLFDACSPYGYPGPVLSAAALADEPFADEALTAFAQGLRERRIVACFVRLHPLLPAPHAALGRVGQVVHHGNTVSIDLTLPEHERWPLLRRNHRQQINHARRDGYTVQVDPRWDELTTFVAIYHETMRRVGASHFYLFPPDYFHEMRAQLGDCLHLAFIRCGGEVAAAALFAEVCGIVQCHLVGTRTAYLKHSPVKILIHSMASWFQARRNRVLHLGGGVGGREDSLFRFKAGFSAHRHPFHTWRVTPDELLYLALLERATAIRPSHATVSHGYFPAYRAQLFSDLTNAESRCESSKHD